MLSLMAIVEVVSGEPSLLMISLRSQRVRPFLVEGALGVGGGRAAAFIYLFYFIHTAYKPKAYSIDRKIHVHQRKTQTPFLLHAYGPTC